MVDAGITYVDPFATPFVAHITWFWPLLKIFDAGCGARGAEKPCWNSWSTPQVREGVERPAMVEGPVLHSVEG